MSAEERERIEAALRRIDDLVTEMNHVAVPAARESARGLMEAVLDLHGLALARIMAIVAAESGGALLDKLARDEAARAVLLLYGLHPEDPPSRIRRALGALEPRLRATGLAVALARANGHAAMIRVSGATQSDELRREIEEVIINAAPEVDEVIIEWLDANDVADPVLAG